MSDQPLRILQVNTLEKAGGAACVAWNLHRAYANRGIQSWMAVGQKETNDPNVFQIPNDQARGLWAHGLLLISYGLSTLNRCIRGPGLLSLIIRWMAEPSRQLDIYRGVEDFHYPGSWKVLKLPPEIPDIVHCHNLHGDYYDLRGLPCLSRKVPVLLTLHDAWLLSGHCAHSFDCERWRTGCGQCPDLTIYPSIRRDATEYNWRRKRDLYAKCQLYVATPSRWLMQKVEQSIIAHAVIESRVAPNGVDLSIFHPADRKAVRAALGLPQEAKVLLFAAAGIRTNIWKDYQTMRTAVGIVAERVHGQSLVFLALGEDASSEQIGQAKIHFIPYQKDQLVVVRYYQAADFYIHAARADTFPNTVLEALACGTPVVATAVGGITEQVEDGVTGFLTPPGDAKTMAARIEQLLADNELRQRMGVKAAEVARKRFSLDRQVDEHLEWFADIVSKWQPSRQEQP